VSAGNDGKAPVLNADLPEGEHLCAETMAKRQAALLEMLQARSPPLSELTALGVFKDMPGFKSTPA
jgi:hypothetical protein